MIFENDQGHLHGGSFAGVDEKPPVAPCNDLSRVVNSVGSEKNW